MQITLDHEGYETHAYWTGGTDLGRKGKWIWIDSLEPVPEYAWMTGIRNITMYKTNFYKVELYSVKVRDR